MPSTIEFAIWIFCMIGLGITSYRLGHQSGMEDMVQHLVDEGVLKLEANEDE